MTDAALPDNDHVARYCKPSAVDEQGMPMVGAFQRRSGEPYLSVNWLEHSGTRDIAAATRAVSAEFLGRGYGLRRNGRFAVFNVGSAKGAVFQALGHSLSIDHMPLDDDQSHAGIHGYPPDDLAVAAIFKMLITRPSVHPAMPLHPEMDGSVS